MLWNRKLVQQVEGVSCLQRCVELRDHLLGEQRDTQASLDRLKALIRLIQRHSSRSP